jgi:hypothetical protein
MPGIRLTKIMTPLPSQPANKSIPERPFPFSEGKQQPQLSAINQALFYRTTDPFS